MAFLTLENISRRPAFTSASQVKISKVHVTGVIFFSKLIYRNQRWCERFLKICARNLPVTAEACETNASHSRVESWFNQYDIAQENSFPI
jgi:hypothetical protein